MGKKARSAHSACSCLSSSRHIVISLQEAAQLRIEGGQHYVFDKFVTGKHIGHAKDYGMSPLNGVAFLKDSMPLADHEKTILKISTESLPDSTAFFWTPDLDARGGTCFEESFTRTVTARIATNEQDAGGTTTTPRRSSTRISSRTSRPLSELSGR